MKVRAFCAMGAEAARATAELRAAREAARTAATTDMFLCGQSNARLSAWGHRHSWESTQRARSTCFGAAPFTGKHPKIDVVPSTFLDSPPQSSLS